MVTASSSRPVAAQTGKGGDIAVIILKNILFTIITLGIYRFWAKTNVRRFLWSTTEVEGEPLEYSGTGGELFLGFLIGMVVIIAPPALMFGLGAISDNPAVIGVTMLIAYVYILCLMPVAIWRARLYKLSRTSWSGIRFGQSGSSLGYLGRFFGTGFVQVISLGFATPWADVVMTRYAMRNTLIGNQPLQFDASAGRLFGRFVVAFLVSIGALVFAGTMVAITNADAIATYAQALQTGDDQAMVAAFMRIYITGILWYLAALPVVVVAGAWYVAKKLEIFAEGTRFGSIRFASELRAGSLIAFAFLNVLILIFTLGLGMPYVLLRGARLLAKNLKMEGQIDLESVRQSQLAGPKTGEGLAAAFDIGAV